MTSSVPEHKSAESSDVVRSAKQQRRQQGDVEAAVSARDGVLHWCYSKYLQVRAFGKTCFTARRCASAMGCTTKEKMVRHWLHRR